MKCPKCHYDNPSNSELCKECGTQLLPSEKISAHTKTLKTPMRGAIKDVDVGDIIDEKYKLIEELGSGGMGVVYKAEQKEPVKRNVALKVIKLGMDTKEVVARFETERQALAVMKHPNIAKVHDAGATKSGRPYFAMELVSGIPIADYCDLHKLTIKGRLELFILVCEAVQHAHQKGVIHRDLKPSNVLVEIQEDKPVPKIIDFGIAKATEHRLTERTLFTEQGQLIGTPEYMSPEQAEMSGLDIDTRTDIYSLGVMLYELLVGVLPFDPKALRSAGFGEIQRIIREEEPPRASTRLSSLDDTQTTIAKQRRTDVSSLHKQLKGDLDWIMMKTLEKDRTRRYSSPSELATDIRRHLRHEPVLASPPGRIYRIRKFVRRHRLGVSSVAALILLLFVLALTMTVQGRRIARERDRANREAEAASQVSEFLTDLFKVSDPSEARGNTITAREILDKGVAKVEEELKDQTEILATLMTTMAIVYQNLGLFDQSASLFEKALSIRRQQYGDEHLVVSESMYSYGRLLSNKADYERAESLLLDALQMHQKLNGDQQLYAEMVNELGGLFWRKGDYEAAEPLFREALSVSRKLYGDEHKETSGGLNNLGLLLLYKGDYDSAEPLLREALTINRKLLGDIHPDVADGLNNLAFLLEDKGQLREAESLYSEALEMNRKLYGEEHPRIANSINNLASIRIKKGDYASAESLFREALAMRKKMLGDRHPDVAASLNNLARVLEIRGDYESAETLYRDSLDMLREAVGNEHPSIAIRLHNLATVLGKKKEYAKAESMYIEALGMFRKLLGENHPHVARCLHSLANLLTQMGRYKEAETLFHESIEIRQKALPEGHPMTISSMRELGNCLIKLKRFEEAEKLLLECWENFASKSEISTEEITKTLEYIVDLYTTWGKPEKAAEYRALLKGNEIKE